MNTEQDISPYYFELPGARRGRPFRDAGGFQLGWFLASGMLAAMSFVIHQPLIGSAFIAICLLGMPGEEGPYYLYPRIWWKNWQVKRDDDIVHGKVPGRKKERYAVPILIDNFLGDFGTIYHEPTNTDTVFWAVEGWRHAFADLPERHAAYMAIAAAFKTAIAQTDQNIAYQFINGRRPFDPSLWAMDVEQHYMADDFFGAELHPADQAAMANLELALGNMVVRQKAKYLGMIAVTVYRPESWEKIIDHPEEFTVRQLRQSSLYRVLTALEEGLRQAGFVGLELLDADALHRYVYDIFRVDDITLEERVAGKVGRYYRLPDVDEAELPRMGADGKPEHIREPFERIRVVRSGGRRYDTLQVDDNSYHCVIVTKRFQRKRALPGGAYPITGKRHQPWVIHSETCNTASQRVDKWLLRKRRNIMLAWLNNRGGLGTIYEEQEERDRADAERSALDTLYVSGSKPIRSNHAFVVSATSLEELEESYDSLLSTLRQEEIRYRRVTGRSTLLPWFMEATLGPRL